MSVRSFRRAHARRATQARSRPGRRGRLVAGLAVSGSLLLTPAALANTYQVTTTGDDSGATSHCAAPVSPSTTYTCVTLRDAITDANATSTANTITFASGVTGTIGLGATLDITGPGGLTITGPGSDSLTISGENHVQDISLAPTHSADETLTGLTITDGSSSTDGGAIATNGDTSLTLTGDTVSASQTTGSDHDGGGVYADGPLTVSGSTFSNNSATGSAGGIDASGSPTSITGSTFTGNRADGNGGAFVGGGELTVAGSTLSGNHAQTSGGALSLTPKYGDVTIADSTVSGNTAGDDGGLDLDVELGTVRVLDSTVSGNQAQYAGGLATRSEEARTLIEGTTVSGNVATGGYADTGGLAISGYGQSETQVVDSTISGNTAAVAGGASVFTFASGGGASPYTTSSFDNSTIADNSATAHGGGIYLPQEHYGQQYIAPNIELNSSIVAGNTAAGVNDDLERGGATTSGGTVDANYSLIGAPGSVPVTNNHTLIGINPQLGPLQNNGGPTDTMLPSGTSPVIDQGKASPGLTTDQRGDPRTVQTAIPDPPGGDGTDIGAVELAANQVVVPPTPPTPSSGTTLSIRGSGLNLTSSPLLVGSQTPVTCSVKAGVLHSCVIEVRNAAGTLLGSGEVVSMAGASSLTTEVKTTMAGSRYLKSRQLGTPATATLTASQTASGSPTASGNVTYLAGPSITVGLGARSSTLSKGVISELGRVAKLLAGTRSFTCTAYTSPGTNSAKLTKTIAGSACSRLKRDGLSGRSRAVGRGSTGQVASNKTKKGQAANRRLTITFSF